MARETPQSIHAALDIPTGNQQHHAGDHSLNGHKPLRFPTQRPNEHVILLLRRHWTVAFLDVVQLLGALIVPPIIIVAIALYTDFSIDTGGPLYIIIVEALSLYYLFAFLTYFHDFVDYHLDIWVVTDQRIVSIEQEGLFNRVVSEFNILKVQDVTSAIKGKVQTFLDYGSVHIQTAGDSELFLFEQVPHPAEVAKVILQVHDRAIQLNNLKEVQEGEAVRLRMDAQYAAQHAGTGATIPYSTAVSAPQMPPQYAPLRQPQEQPQPLQVRPVPPLQPPPRQ